MDMQVSVSFGLEDLAHLPLDLRQRIHQALMLPVVATATTVQPPSPPMQYMPPPQQMSQIPLQQAPPAPYVPPVAKSPLIQGSTKMWMPDMGHPTQVNSAVDVTTGRPIPVAAMSDAPVVPQYANAPVNVVAVPMNGQPVVGPHPNCDTETARGAAIRLYRNEALGGVNALNAAVERAGIGSMSNLNAANASALYAAILSVGGQ
jgi:hypothetical protein